MNITITIDELDMGGAQHIIYAIVNNIDTKAYHITIICVDGRVYSFLEELMLNQSDEKKYSIIFLKNRSLKKINTRLVLINKIINRLRQMVIDLTIIPELCQALKKTRPDVIHANQHGILALYWALVHKIPVITTIHTNPKAAIFREVERFIFKVSLLLRRNIIVAISAYNRNQIKSYWRLDDMMARYVNNGIEIENFYHKPHDIFTFINTSRQDMNKNQALILRAFARLYNENTRASMKLYLVGDGDTHEELKQLAVKYGIEKYVDFTGYMASTAEYLALSDVYISSAHREGLSLSALEAMAARLPVIATDVGGVRDLAQENGILINDNDEEALYAAMKELRDNTTLWQAKSDKSYEMVQDFSAKVMAQKYSELYDEVFYYNH
jgi:glycosyltransferase involved in cell wall biosynthesis